MIMSRSSGRRGASRSHNLVWGRTLSGKVGSWAIRSELSCFRTNWKTGCSLLPSHPRQKKGQIARGLLRSGDQRRGLLLPAQPALPPLAFPPRSRPGRGRLRLGRRQHPARVRQEGPSGKEGTTPTPAAATPGFSRRAWGPRPAPGSSESGPPPRGGRQMGLPPARPVTRAGNSRQGCQEGGREWRGGAHDGPAPEGRCREGRDFVSLGIPALLPAVFP